MNANHQTLKDDVQITNTAAVSPDTYSIDTIVEGVEKHFETQITEEEARTLAAEHAEAGLDTFDNLRNHYSDAELARIYSRESGRIEIQDPDPYINYWDDVAGAAIGAEPVPYYEWGVDASTGKVLYYILKDASPVSKMHVCDFAVEVEFSE